MNRTEELIARSQSGDQKAKETLLEENADSFGLLQSDLLVGEQKQMTFIN